MQLRGGVTLLTEKREGRQAYCYGLDDSLAALDRLSPWTLFPTLLLLSGPTIGEPLYGAIAKSGEIPIVAASSQLHMFFLSLSGRGVVCCFVFDNKRNECQREGEMQPLL